VHIVFLELIIDPSCSLIFEAEEAEADVMKRPPRNPTERLFSLRTIAVAVMQGLSVLAACVGVLFAARVSHSMDAARALMFATLVVSFLFVIFINRSWTRTIVGMRHTPNPAMRWVIFGTTLFLALVLYVPFAQKMFHFATLHPGDLVFSLAIGAACVLWFELVKLIRKAFAIG
jgi:Ca2+-transporting ATPase